MTYNAAHKAGLVGGLRHGCELGGPTTRAARLVAPLKGSVELTTSSPRKVASIQILGGAKAKGVGVGSTGTAVSKAFPKVKVDHSTDATFAVTLYRVPKSFEFAVSTSTHRVATIGVPTLAFCD